MTQGKDFISTTEASESAVRLKSSGMANCKFCAQAENEPFKGKGIDHVCTMNSNVLDDTQLQSMLDKGSQFRCCGAENFIAEQGQDVKSYITRRLIPWAEQFASRNGIGELELRLAVKEFAEQVDHGMSSLDVDTEVKVDASRCKSYWKIDKKNPVRKLVVCHVDKINGQFCYVCIKQYTEWLLKTMESDMFEEIREELHGESRDQILHRINESTVEFGVADPKVFDETDEEGQLIGRPVKHSNMYLMIKLHKESGVSTRDVAGG